MGTDINAYLLFDTSRSHDEPPFHFDNIGCWNLACDDELASCHDYDFYAAIAGVRNSTEKSPLIAPRGLPRYLEFQPLAELDNGEYFAVGWLTFSEINAAIDHFELNRDWISYQIRIVLKTMEYAESIYGTDRVRLVFGFD